MNTRGRKSPLTRQVGRLEVRAREQQDRYASLLEPDPELDERLRRRIESITDPEEAGRVGLIMIGVMAANAGEADTLRRLEASGQSPERARALLASAQEQRRQNPEPPGARSPWARFDPDGRPYAAARRSH